MQEYRHAHFKDVIFTDDTSVLRPGFYPTGRTAGLYSEEGRINQMASILGYAQCFDHNLHLRGTVSYPAQWFLHDGELLAPTPKYWD
ncbi:hypothetical protein BTE56_03215 [Agrobacterium pusense]|nr:hypothetical protein BTE56_03215 [Agrobacterium pusense]